ncbi:hypothetical protein F2Q68_00038775 [Brassica cretica]|uniref:Uncharacterized protein n=1 Tax=Brassica cretica TaxID=69181 RepID=A0A8S9MDM8_BRACR|nr:hypothetical protein F2Q68_00038775 [Brassica cretica]
MGDEEYVLAFEMSKLRNELQGFDRHDQEVSCLAKFCYRIGEDGDSADMFPGLQNHLYSTSAKSDLGFFN